MEQNNKRDIKELEQKKELLYKAKNNVDKKIKQNENDIKKYKLEHSVREWFRNLLRKTLHVCPESERDELQKKLEQLQEQMRIKLQNNAEEIKRLKRDLSKANQKKMDAKAITDKWKTIQARYAVYEKLVAEGKIKDPFEKKRS